MGDGPTLQEQVEQLRESFGEVGRAIMRERAVHATLATLWLCFVAFAVLKGFTDGWGTLIAPERP